MTLDQRHHGKGSVLYSWHPSSLLLASVGTPTGLISHSASSPSVTSASSATTHASTSSSSGSLISVHSHRASGAHPNARPIHIWYMDPSETWKHVGGGKQRAGIRAVEAALASAAAQTAAAASSTAQTAAASSPAVAAIPASASSFSRPHASSSPSSRSPSSSSASSSLPSVTCFPLPQPTNGLAAASGTVGGGTDGTTNGVCKLFQITPPTAAACIGMEWDATGSILAILQAPPAHEILFWHLASQELEIVELSIGDCANGSGGGGGSSSAASSSSANAFSFSFIRWSKVGQVLALGTTRGEVLFYDRSKSTPASTSNSTSVPVPVVHCAAARHKKKITCGDWNREGKFAFASDDRQITICAGMSSSSSSSPSSIGSGSVQQYDATGHMHMDQQQQQQQHHHSSQVGKTFGQVKVKSRPTNVKFGGNDLGGGGGSAFGRLTHGHQTGERENIVSVSMDRKTILLYNLDDPENALELAFQQRYGHIVSFKWFRDGYVMVGFSLGFLVVISTHLDEIGREQFCARFHMDGLRDIAYAPHRHQVATAGDSVIKIVDMREWREVKSQEIFTTTPSTSAHHQTTPGADSPSLRSYGHGSSPVDKVAWSADGRFISLSTRNGCLYVYDVDGLDSGVDSPRNRREWMLMQQRLKELDERQTTLQRILYKPLNHRSLVLYSALTVTAGIMGLSTALGASMHELWMLATRNFSF